MYNSSTRGESLTHAESECTPRSSLARVYVTATMIARKIDREETSCDRARRYDAPVIIRGTRENVRGNAREIIGGMCADSPAKTRSVETSGVSSTSFRSSRGLEENVNLSL